MRIFLTLATLLALHATLDSGGLYAGDELPGLTEGALVPAVTTQAGCDTSVYHLEHAHAAQLIGRVKSLITQISAYAADEDVASLPKSLVLLSTTTDDTIIAICPKAHAALVKHAIKSCDTLKQYAVKVQLFEVADNGKTIPVGGPHLLIGRSGNLQCAADGEAVSVDFKVDLVTAATSAASTDPAEGESAEAAGSEACAACGTAGRCHLDCPPPIGEMAVESGCGACTKTSGAETTAAESASSACCSENGTCTAMSGTCAACKSGTCAACKTGTCAACKTGTCTGECCAAGCCHGQAAAGSCSASGCKCDGSCCNSSENGENASGTTSYEETSTECPACHAHKQFSVGLGFGTGLHLIGPIVWFNKGTEPRCAACAATNQIADSDDGHDFESSNMVPPAPADATPTDSTPAPTLTTHSFVVTTGNNGQLLLNAAPGEGNGKVLLFNSTSPISSQQLINLGLAIGSGAKTGFIFQANAAEDTPPGDHSGSSCTDGCPLAVTGLDEVPATPNAPCSCEEPAEGTQAPGAEPPALLTLSQHKEPAPGLPSAPAWQEELLKAFRGRRLSELFEPQAGQTTGGHDLGRLLAEFPKHPGIVAGHSGHSLTIVDMPDRVRIFECDASHPETEKVSECAKTTVLNTCSNCREEFRVLLEEMFRGPEATDEIAQAAHHEGDVKATEAARDLPNVTHSKIAAVTIAYPLRDLVLCDDAGRPVFDTCTIIDHLQSAVAPESWSHPSVSIQLDQQSVSLVVKQTAEVHQKIADHLRYLRRLQVKQICGLIEKMSGDVDDNSEPTPATEAVTPTADVELGPALPVGK
jgi:hypothetical protein